GPPAPDWVDAFTADVSVDAVKAGCGELLQAAPLENVTVVLGSNCAQPGFANVITATNIDKPMVRGFEREFPSKYRILNMCYLLDLKCAGDNPRRCLAGHPVMRDCGKYGANNYGVPKLAQYGF